MIEIPKYYTPIEPVVCWSGAFTDKELDNICEMGDHRVFMEAKVGSSQIDGSGNENSEIRKSQVSWISPDENTHSLFCKIAELVSTVNADKFQFELNNLPAFQYTTYKTGGFYDWHIDADYKTVFGPWHRKLGISILLSTPEEDFTGGEFQFIAGGNPTQIEIAKCKRGDILAFPSFIPHRVTEVTSGTRKSLVAWITGPKFK